MGPRALAVALILLVLAACGDSGDDAPPPPQPRAVPRVEQELEAVPAASESRRKTDSVAETDVDRSDPAAAWLKQLRDPNVGDGQKAKAADQLADLGKAALPMLVAALEDPDAASWAMLAIARMGADGGPAALEISRLLGDPHFTEGAAAALAELGGAAVQCLWDVARSGNPRARRAAAEVLGTLKTDSLLVVPALLTLLSDADADVREAAANAVGRVTRDAPACLPALCDALRDSSVSVRTAAARSIGSFGPLADGCVESLVGTFTDSDARVAAAAIAALGRIGPGASASARVLVQIARESPKWTPHAIDALLRIQPERVAEFLTGGDEQIRIAVATESLRSRENAVSLARAGFVPVPRPESPELAAAWRAALDDPLAGVRLAAIHETTRDGLAAADEPKIRSSLSFADASVRAAAAGALGKAAAPSAELVADLVRRLKDDDARVRLQAAASLSKLAAFPAITLPGLAAALDDEQPFVAAAAARALGAWGAAAADYVPDLRRCLARDDADVRLRAAAALCAIDPSSNEGPAAVTRLLTDASSNVRREAVEALAATGRKDAIPSLIERLDDGNRDVRIAAAKALAGYGPAADAAAQTLLRMLASRDEEILKAAREALTAIRPK